MARKPPTPIDPRDRVIDELINDKNRLYIEMKRLEKLLTALRAQKRLLKSRIKFLQEIRNGSKEKNNNKNNKKRSAKSK